MSDDLDGIMPAIVITEEELDKIDLTAPQVRDPEYYHAAAYLKAAGAEPLQIATLLGVALENITQALSLKRVKDLTFDIQKKNSNRDYANLFKDLLPDAVEVTRELMLSPVVKEGTRLSAAIAVMDRALGKPQQNVEVGSSLIRDLFSALDRHEKAIQTKEIQIEAKKVNNDVVEAEFTEGEKVMENKIDAWAKENIK